MSHMIGMIFPTVSQVPCSGFEVGWTSDSLNYHSSSGLVSFSGPNSTLSFLLPTENWSIGILQYAFTICTLNCTSWQKLTVINTHYMSMCPVHAGFSNAGYSSNPRQSYTSQQVSSTKLSDCHMSSLLQQLSEHAAKWREIGTYLGFRPGELDNICGDLLLHTPTDWLQKMLSQWLQWAPKDGRGSNSFATLEDLKAALNQAGLGATAHDLKVWIMSHYSTIIIVLVLLLLLY